MAIRLTPPRAWGTRAQLGGTVQALKEALGDKDGVWNHDAGAVDVLEKNPLVNKIERFFEVGLSVEDEMQVLARFVERYEQEHGLSSILTVDADRLNGGALFAAQKAIALTQLGRDPSTVSEGFVQAKGSVNGEAIAPRELFYQRFAPTAAPSGKLIVISPGFQETGRNFYEQIQKMNDAGHEVIVMDHQWAGQSDGSPGGLDRGFGVARDVAAMAAHAQRIVDDSDTLDEVVLFGNSMGAGPGVLGALTLNDAGKIALDGPAMPRGLKAVLQAPYLAPTPNPLNEVLGFASRLPFLNRLQAPSAGVPVLTTDDTGAHKGAQHAVLEDVRAQLQTMTAAADDLSVVRELIASGQGPQGQLAIVHGDDDPLADPAMSRWIDETLGDKAELRQINSDSHVLQENPGEQDVALDALERLLRR